MSIDKLTYDKFLAVLHEELIPAMGCTEPIAVAYASAEARKVLGKKPDRVKAEISNSIIKNVKSVIVPNTGGMKGISASVAAGMAAGDPDARLEVLASIKPEQRYQIEEFLNNVPIDVEHLERGHVFDIIITAYAGNDYAEVQIVDFHTNIVQIKKNGDVIFSNPSRMQHDAADRSFINFKAIFDFASEVSIIDLKDTIGKQITNNIAISHEGLLHDYGVCAGKLLMESGKTDITNALAASSAAGSDARMSGCEMPVIINSGSGNQGIACSTPVITYATIANASEEEMYRALVVSNLVTIYQQDGIGTLSAYCGVISAGIGSAAGIAYLRHHSLEAIEATVSNALGISSGVVCDGAKPSCALKSALAVKTGIIGLKMYENGRNLKEGDGLIGKNGDATVKNIWRLAKQGMTETNDEIINIMLGK